MGRDEEDPAKVMLGEAEEENKVIGAAPTPESAREAAEFGFGLMFGEHALESTPEELNDRSGSLEFHGTVEAESD
jgi:hypothetical protein